MDSRPDGKSRWRAARRPHRSSLWTTDPQGTSAARGAPSAGTIQLTGPALQFGRGCPELSAQGPREPPNPDWPWGCGVRH